MFKRKYFPTYILKSEMVRNATVLMSGTVIAQLLSILLQPILRRLFTPESFGIYSVYLSLTGIIIVISSLRYDDAIVLPKSDKESVNLIGLSLVFNLTISLLIFVLVFLLGGKIISFLNLPSNFPEKMLYIVPVGTFLLGTYQSLNNWLIRKKKYYSISLNKLVRRSSEGIAQLSFAFLKSFNGLIYSDIIGQATNVSTVSYQARKNGLTFKLLSVTKLKYVFTKYSDFPKYNLIPSFMSACSYLLPPIFINKFFSPETAGYFDLSKLLLTIPIAFIASSISSVLLQRVTEKFNRKETIISDLKPIFYIVGLISIAEIFAIRLFGEDIFKIVFGNQWIMSGAISKIMVWSLALNFVVSSFTNIFVSMRKIKTYSAWQLIYFLSILSLLFFKDLPFISFLKIYVGIEVFCYTIVTVLMIFIVYRYESAVSHP
jgi:O-antigen/teichoic acid export membrane protein